MCSGYYRFVLAIVSSSLTFTNTGVQRTNLRWRNEAEIQEVVTEKVEVPRRSEVPEIVQTSIQRNVASHNSYTMALEINKKAARVIWQKAESLCTQLLVRIHQVAAQDWRFGHNLLLHVLAGGLTPNLHFSWRSGTPSNTVCHWTPQWRVNPSNGLS